MKKVEFETRIDPKGCIAIPNDMQQNFKKNELVKVTIYDKQSKRYNSVARDDKSIDNIKDFWENYEIEGLWNGE